MAEAKAQPYTFDLGHLLCNDANPLPSLKGDDREAILAATARDCAQGLINQLLTTCPITTASDKSLQISLPPPTTHLPREKPVPKEKEKTKWERFAEKKGIKGKKRDGKLVFDDAKGDWVPKYGYKGREDPAANWMVEIDEKAERAKELEEANGGGKKKKARKSR